MAPRSLSPREAPKRIFWFTPAAPLERPEVVSRQEFGPACSIPAISKKTEPVTSPRALRLLIRALPVTQTCNVRLVPNYLFSSTQFTRLILAVVPPHQAIVALIRTTVFTHLRPGHGIQNSSGRALPIICLIDLSESA